MHTACRATLRLVGHATVEHDITARWHLIEPITTAACAAHASLGVVCHPHFLAMAIAKAAERATNCYLMQLRIGANAIECATVSKRAAYGQHTAVKHFWQAYSHALPIQALAWRPTLGQSSQQCAM